MGDQATAVPAALRCSRPVTLSNGKTVNAIRWAWPEFMDVIENLDKWLENIPNVQVDRIMKGTTIQAALGFLQILGKKAPDFCRLGVDKPELLSDAELTPADVMAVFTEIMELNLDDNLVKNGAALWTKYQHLSRARK
jgi:hypothetical protein